MGERSRELVQALDSHSRDATALVTLTLRHHAGIPLDVLRTLLNRSWSEIFAGRKGQAFREALGVFGHIRAAEQTFGDNGWHPHLHCLVFFESTPAEGWEQLITERWLACVAIVYERLWKKALEGLESDADAVKICRVLGKRFSRPDLRTGCERFREGLARMGGLMAIMPSDERAVRAELVNHDAAATYLSKLGCELTGITSKAGKPGHYTHWQIGQLAAAGEQWARRLWVEHSAAMVYSRQLTWSRGLRDRLGLKPERPDEEVAAQLIPEEGAIDVPLGEYEGEEWDFNVKTRRQLFIAELHERYAEGTSLDNLEGPILPSAKPVEPAPLWITTLARDAYGRARMRERFEVRRAKDSAFDARMKLNREDRELALEDVSHHFVCDLGFAPF